MTIEDDDGDNDSTPDSGRAATATTTTTTTTIVRSVVVSLHDDDLDVDVDVDLHDVDNGGGNAAFAAGSVTETAAATGRRRLRRRSRRPSSTEDENSTDPTSGGGGGGGGGGSSRSFSSVKTPATNGSCEFVGQQHVQLEDGGSDTAMQSSSSSWKIRRRRSSDTISCSNNAAELVEALYRTTNCELVSNTVSSSSHSSSVSAAVVGSTSSSSSRRRSRSSPLQRQSEVVLQQLTINKLRYGALGVVGRDKEIQQLHDCIDRCRSSSASSSSSTSLSIDTTAGGSSSGNSRRRMKTTTTKKELVFIDGYAGVGKTALISALQSRIATSSSTSCGRGGGGGGGNGNNTGGGKYSSSSSSSSTTMMMVQGKFDSHSNDVPYSGLITAFGDLCWRISHGGGGGGGGGDYSSSPESTPTSTHTTIVRETLLEQLRNGIMKSLGRSEIRLLNRLIPELEAIISHHDVLSEGTMKTAAAAAASSMSENNNNIKESEENFGADFERLKYALRVLARIFASFFSPLVLVLDDLQWVDASSLEVIDYLLSDVDNKNGLVIIGLYRSNEVDDGHPLKNKTRELHVKKEMFGFHITEIRLQNLDVDGINKIIMSLLDIDDESLTNGLAEICYKKTYGNPFFIISFLTILEEEGFLTYNIGLLKWIWDDELIEKETMSTENVVDLLRARMRKLPDELQRILQIASCLGSTFKIATIKLISEDTGCSDDTVVPLLESLEAGSFIERSGKDIFRWVHDKVQEAAQSLGDASHNSFQYALGMKLLNGLDDRQLGEALFDVVNLINKASTFQSPELAILNLRAAEKARGISAFQSASVYASHGIRFLPRDSWQSYRDVTLRLYTLRGEMAVALGDDDTMDTCTRTVLSRQELSVLDRVPIYVTKLHKLAYVDMRFEATVELCLKVLKELGCALPKGSTLPARAASSYIRTLRKVKKIPGSDFENPRKMTDPKLKAAMMILARLFYAVCHTKSPFLVILTVCRMIELTLKHGVSTDSGYAYAGFGMLHMAATGNIQLSSSLAETALIIDRSSLSNYHKCTTMNMCHGILLPHTKPLYGCIKELADCQTQSLRAGNVEIAIWNDFTVLVQMSDIMGRPIPPIDTYLSAIAQMEDLKQTEQAILTRAYAQVLLNLKGLSTATTKIKGSVFDVDEFQANTPIQSTFIGHFEAELFLFFGEYRLAAESALKRGEEFGKAWVGSPENMVESFYRAIALYAMARRSKSRKYRRPADKLRKKIRKWQDAGNPNLKHVVTLLHAEHAAVHGRVKDAAKLYEEAIVFAARTGHLHHAGLFNERYADLLRTSLQDEDEARYRIQESIRWYTEWGAMAVVKRLQSNKC